ncbi:MAG: YncE family protein, partial [Muribaculaceae bacterium]|nr:YncE family protein [Muribaculaceae bacterium]
INGQRMYAVINQSHKVEVMDAATSVRIGQVNIDNPRYIVFDSENAYVSSYVGGEGESGSVVRFNLSTLEVTGKVSVGLSPEEMVISGGKLYVANSALFKGNETTFDNTVSIIDLASFSKTGSIEVDVNLHHLKADGNGNLWANSRGNYGNIPARLHKLGRGTDGSYTVTASYDLPCTNFTIADNKLYYYATVYDASWNAVQSYGTIDTASGNDLGSFITDGTDADIATPYAIAIHPDTGDIYLTDAKNYVSSGSLFCYSKDGKRKWAVKTGDVPGHLAFLKK